MTDKDTERWVAGLESMGYHNVLAFLAGVDAEAHTNGIPGIVSEPPHPPRNFVENWIENEGATRGSSRATLLRLIAIAIAAAGVAGAVISTWPHN